MRELIREDGRLCGCSPFSLYQLLQAEEIPVPRQTLRRWLAEDAQAGLIEPRRLGRDIRYVWAETAKRLSSRDSVTADPAAEDAARDPGARETATYRYGVKLTDGDVLWQSLTYELTPDQVLPKMMELSGCAQGRPVPSHELIWDGEALRMVGADKILYRVLGINK